MGLRTTALCLVVIASASAILPIRVDGSADAPVSPTKAMGRVFFSESGWSSPADQHLIVRVYERRLALMSRRHLRGLSYGERLVWIAKRYSTRTFDPAEVRSIPKTAARGYRHTWINGMEPRCSKPPLWPELTPSGKAHPPWDPTFRPLCRALFTRARAFVERRALGSCSASMPVDHWGGEMDDHRALAFGWLRVDWKCTEGGQEYRAVNRAWCDPGLSKCVGDDT